MKKDKIVISDRLLSWVLGCECELEMVCVDLKCGKIEIESVFFLMLVESNKIKIMPKKINLHTFIHLAKIKAFESKYFINQSSRYAHVLYESKLNDYEAKEFNKYQLSKTPFDIREIIDCLEWVAEKAGGEG